LKLHHSLSSSQASTTPFFSEEVFTPLLSKEVTQLFKQPYKNSLHVSHQYHWDPNHKTFKEVWYVSAQLAIKKYTHSARPRNFLVSTKEEESSYFKLVFMGLMFLSLHWFLLLKFYRPVIGCLKKKKKRVCDLAQDN